MVSFEHSWLELDKQALRDNYLFLQKKLEKKILAPVLKSNAYGHGLAEVYEMISDLNPEFICVNYLEEAKKLRSFGFKGRILVVGPVCTQDIDHAYEFRAELTLGSFSLLTAWLKLQAFKRPKLHLKFDTGMGRQGFSTADTLKVYEKVCSHLIEILLRRISHCINIK